jgi:coenzyme PQQ precursor peptide PqqA
MSRETGAPAHQGVRAMTTWEAPTFEEIKMDAEINSYQDDFGQEPDDRF